MTSSTPELKKKDLVGFFENAFKTSRPPSIPTVASPSITTKLFVNVWRNLESIDVATHIRSFKPMLAMDEYTKRWGSICSIVQSLRKRSALLSDDEKRKCRLEVSLPPFLWSLLLMLMTKPVFILEFDPVKFWYLEKSRISHVFRYLLQMIIFRMFTLNRRAYDFIVLTKTRNPYIMDSYRVWSDLRSRGRLSFPKHPNVFLFHQETPRRYRTYNCDRQWIDAINPK